MESRRSPSEHRGTRVLDANVEFRLALCGYSFQSIPSIFQFVVLLLKLTQRMLCFE